MLAGLFFWWMRMESHNSLHKERQKLWKLRRLTETGADVATAALHYLTRGGLDNFWFYRGGGKTVHFELDSRI